MTSLKSRSNNCKKLGWNDYVYCKFLFKTRQKSAILSNEEIYLTFMRPYFWSGLERVRFQLSTRYKGQSLWGSFLARTRLVSSLTKNTSSGFNDHMPIHISSYNNWVHHLLWQSNFFWSKKLLITFHILPSIEDWNTWKTIKRTFISK